MPTDPVPAAEPGPRRRRAASNPPTRLVTRRERRDWPAVDPADPVSNAQWRTTCQERLDQVAEDLDGMREDNAKQWDGLRTDLQAAARASHERTERCIEALTKVVGAVTQPTWGFISLCAMALVLALAMIGWSAVDVAQLVGEAGGLKPTATVTPGDDDAG